MQLLTAIVVFVAVKLLVVELADVAPHAADTVGRTHSTRQLDAARRPARTIEAT